MILDINQLTSFYGASQVLFNVSLQVNTSEAVCIIGRNGVGKSTTLKTIAGVVKPRTGTINFNGTSIGGLRTYQISRLGLAYVPQGRCIFPNLTTRENLLLSERKNKNPGTGWNLDKIHKLFPILKTRENSMGGRLSGGEQQMLTIARGLMQNPKLILLDEICEGLAPIIVKELEDIIQELRNSGVAILIAEQNVKFALAVSSRCYILEKGQVMYNGISSDIPKDILLKYLGT
jgi:branched-chain amino acid transport system ATP-binding protein